MPTAPRKKVRSSRESRVVEIRRKALHSCDGDVNESSIVLSEAILRIEVDRDEPAMAARALMLLSERFKQASLHHGRIVQLRALDVELTKAKSDDEKRRIRANISRLAPSDEQVRARDVLQRDTDEWHLAALKKQLHTADTMEDRRKIVRRIEELDSRLNETRPSPLSAEMSGADAGTEPG